MLARRALLAAMVVIACQAAGPAAGQVARNQLGIYSGQAGDPFTANFMATVNVPFYAYLVLTHPTNLHFDDQATERPVTAIDGFSARILTPDDPTFFVLGETFPADVTDAGERPDYLVQFAIPVPVTDDAVVLCTWQILTMSPAVYNVFLAIPAAPSLPGAMSLLDADDPDADPRQEILPSTGDFQVPVFSVNGHIAVDPLAWGAVKTLYR